MSSVSRADAYKAAGEYVYQELLDRLLFETLLTDISARFVRAPANTIDSEIERSQRDICESLGLDHSSVWQVTSKHPGKFSLTHVYRARADLPPVPEELDGFEAFPWVASKVTRNELIDLSDTSKAPPDARRDQATWAHFGVKSALAFPLSMGSGPVFGVLSFESTRGPREWPEDLKSRLSLIAQVFANALERKFADQRLQESEARLNLAANSGHAGLWSLEINTGRMWASESAKVLFSYPPEAEITLPDFLEGICPEDRSTVERAIADAIRSGEEASVHYRTMSPDGNVRWLVSRGRAHRYGDNEPHLLMGVTTDVTDIRQAEHERAELAGKLLNAQESESARIARELHDDLGQRVSLIGMQFKAAMQKVIAGSPPVHTLQEIGTRITEISHRISLLSHRLHSSELEYLGLSAAAASLCREVADQYGVRVPFSSVISRRLESGIELCLYRILQESLNNAVRHGKATSIEVNLNVAAECAQLRVKDNGGGFDPTRSSAGLGLTSMRERARLVGGECRVRSSLGEGVTVEANIPLQAVQR